MGRPCSSCNHDERRDIDAALVLGVEPLRSLAKRFGIDRQSLSRHRQMHVSPALATVAAERATAGPRSALQRIEDLTVRVERVLDKAEQDGQAKLLLDAARELRSLVELLAKITGELRDQPQVAIVLTQSDEWQRFAAGLLGVLDDFPPELGQRVLHELQAATHEPPRPEAGGQGGLAASGPAHSGRGAPPGGEAA